MRQSANLLFIIKKSLSYVFTISKFGGKFPLKEFVRIGLTNQN